MHNEEIRRLKHLSGIKEDASSSVFQIMKKSLLRAKWYLENEEMDPEMVSSELRDVNAMLNAVGDGISDMSKVGLDTSVDEQYMSLYREAIAKLKGEKTSIYGVDNDVLPPDAKPTLPPFAIFYLATNASLPASSSTIYSGSFAK